MKLGDWIKLISVDSLWSFMTNLSGSIFPHDSINVEDHPLRNLMYSQTVYNGFNTDGAETYEYEVLLESNEGQLYTFAVNYEWNETYNEHELSGLNYKLDERGHPTVIADIGQNPTSFVSWGICGSDSCDVNCRVYTEQNCLHFIPKQHVGYWNNPSGATKVLIFWEKDECRGTSEIHILGAAEGCVSPASSAVVRSWQVL